MIKKLLDKWKQEWWLRNASNIAREFQHRQTDLENKLNHESRINIQKLELERDILYAKIKAEIEKGNILEAEVEYREQILSDRKLELIRADNELREQIKLTQAKASPDQIWSQAFTTGVSKTLDMIIPTITSGFDKFKVKVQEDAVQEAIARLRVTNKK